LTEHKGEVEKMWKKITRFIAMTVICCLCSGIVAQAEEPYAESVDMLQPKEEVESTEEETEDKETAEPEKAEPGNAELGSEYPEAASEPEQEDAVQEEQAEEKSEVSASDPEILEQEPTHIQEAQSTQPADIQTKEVSTTQPAAVQKIKPVPRSKKIRVLLVGNSLTSRKGNTTIKNLKKLAKKSGRKLVLKKLTYSNEKMKNWANPKHKNGKRLYREIRSGRWDYIVFQEQTDASVKKSFVSASKKVSKYIHSASPKTEIIYNCTWAYKKGKRISGKYYSFSKMQKTMNQNYQSAASQTGGRVCWSGKAFLTYRKRKGKKKNLYIKDNNHGSKYGWYLNACCLYTSIFGARATESKYYAGLSKKEAKILQKIATMQHL